MSHEALAEEVGKLVAECREVERSLGAQKTAGRIILFPKLLESVEILLERTPGKDLAMARHKLHEATRDFSSLVFSIQQETLRWDLGAREITKVRQSLRQVYNAANELELMLKERRVR